MGMASTVGGAAGLMYTGTSTRPLGDSTTTTSPSCSPCSAASFGLTSTHVCHVTLVIGSGSPCNQGRCAASPLPSAGCGKATRWYGYSVSAPAYCGRRRLDGNPWPLTPPVAAWVRDSSHQPP